MVCVRDALCGERVCAQFLRADVDEARTIQIQGSNLDIEHVDAR